MEVLTIALPIALGGALLYHFLRWLLGVTALERRVKNLEKRQVERGTSR